jgi:hypothetical protein
LCLSLGLSERQGTLKVIPMDTRDRIKDTLPFSKPSIAMTGDKSGANDKVRAGICPLCVLVQLNCTFKPLRRGGSLVTKWPLAGVDILTQ